MSSKKRDSRGGLVFWTAARKYIHEELPLIRRASDKTIEAYRISLECYLGFLKSEHGIQNGNVGFAYFGRQYVQGFAKWMVGTKGYSAKTISLRLTVIRSFLQYASYEDVSLVALFQSAKSVRGPKAPKHPIEHLTHAATTAVLAASGTKTMKQRRNTVMLLFMYDTGSRVSEVATIKAGDIYLDDQSFAVITGKGAKTRSVPIMNKTAEHLKVYLAEFHPDGLSNDPLFYSLRDGRPKTLSTDAIALVLKNAASKARLICPDVPAAMYCHLLRKTRAMDLYQEGVPLPIIMRFLGHESMSTTSSFYAFATLDMVKDAIAKTNDKAFIASPHWKKAHSTEVIYSLK
jgi:site-specific recombinase XerD